MKKRIICLLAIMAFSVCSIPAGVASADYVAPYRYSLYLDEYSVALGARANHQMSISMSVDGTGVMTKIGVWIIYIEQKINGVWSEFDTWDAADHPEFYEYNTDNYLGTVYFTGTKGVQYRVTLTVYASDGSGYDTGEVTSYTVTCK